MPHKDPQVRKEYHKQYNLVNREKLVAQRKEYYLANREKFAERSKQYNLVNRDKLATQHKQYKLSNCEKIAEKQRKYRLANPEKIAEYQKQYRLANPEKTKRYNQRRRAFKASLPATLTQAEWQKILDDHFGRCRYCGAKSDKLHQEHIVPLSKGGGYTKENIVPACRRCNSSKSVKNYKKFIKNSNDRLQLELF